MAQRGIGTDIVRRQHSAVSLPSAPVIRKPRPLPLAPVSRTPARRAHRRAKSTRVQSKRRWLLEAMQYPLIAAIALGAAYSGIFGQLLVGLYIVFAISTRRPGGLSFGAAVFLLVTIPLFQAINQPIIAQNVATYVFELLAFGTAQAIWEQRKIDKTAN